MMPTMEVDIMTPEGPCHFQWIVGGPYIEVRFPGADHASEVINVWDYEAKAAEITTPEEFVAECVAFLDRVLLNGDWFDYLNNARY